MVFKYFAKKETQQLLTLEDWLKGIKEIKDPLKLADILLSDWPFVNKVKVLISLPKKAIDNKIGMRLLESQLEEFGYSQLAQVVRWLSFWNLPKHSLKWGLEWSDCIISTDVEMRRIVQQEIYVQEEIKALRKSLALEEVDDKTERATETAQLKAYETQLQGLNNKYWNFRHFSGEVEGDMPAGILRRAFKSCRTDPEWYLCQWLREDCARRGGCCGRDCGCCEKAWATNRQWSRGHCTRVCGCCIRTQGRSGKDACSEKSKKEDYSFDIVSMESQYSARLNRAYIWRLSFLDELDLCGFFE